MENIIVHPSRNTSLIKSIKAHKYHPWQNYSFCRDNQAQGSLTTKLSWVRPTHTQIPAVGGHMNWPAKFQQQLNSQSPFPSGPNLSNQIRRGHVSLRGWTLSSQAKISSFLMWHKAETDVIESWEASASCPFFLLQPSRSKIKSSHDKATKALETTWNQLIFILKMYLL